MCFQNGIKKVLTLSYDDGGVQDIRLIDLLDKYGVKCTFNICSGTYLEEDAVRGKFYGKLKLSEAKELYVGSGHEIALHSYSHPFLTKIKTNEIVREITEDQRAIARDYGILARGMAYPQGAYDERVMKVLEICGIEYARTCVSTNRFIFPENWLELHPTCKHTAPNLKELITKLFP